jgi:hypothetical protein
MSHDSNAPAPEQLWARLADKQALGEPLSDSERRLMADLERRHPVCEAEGRFYGTLEQALEGAGEVVSRDDPLIRAALREVARGAAESGLMEAEPGLGEPPGIHQPAAEPARNRWPIWAQPNKGLWLGLTALVGGAAGAWLIGLTTHDEGATPDSAPAVVAARTAANEDDDTSRATLLLSTSDAKINGQPLKSGTELAAGSRIETGEGRVCLQLPRDVVTCAAPQTEMTLSSLGRQRALALSRGHLASTLKKQDEGNSYSVVTPEGTLTAVGTTFGVRVAPGGQTSLSVEHGAVMAEASGGQRVVQQDQRIELSSMQVTALADEESQGDAELLSPVRLWTPSDVSGLVLNTSPSGASVSLDGVSMGTTPLSVHVPRGVYQLRVELPGYERVERQLRFDGKPLSETWTLERTEDSEITSAKPDSNKSDSAKPDSASPAELLRTASEARAQGQFARAAQAYRRLQTGYPGTAEARTSVLSLAELELSHLGRPAQALRSFDKYLQRGGALSREALYGKIRALRALGRHTQERQSIRTFLDKYPRSTYATTLRKRLEEL